ncbi:betaine--homocysteine S-methyltransferase 1-like isoform X2 [Pecten maximus]|uniref:betaine--homocysteine S-methyltransferase 1-like isoform X1 n=1 Tax=Pecten maximus TaxID=6579 RepID=UPI001458DC0D|nr:betaine--homocysteine S-methyltransferase 1-like isoform X1 [Pecten maximus]XP_033745754.1 betaine--homocysteine S-methyltransferase 1-like isoform X2 [Pecten maximus]
MSTKGLLERLRDGESVVVAEGYIFEFERRGYLTAGTFVPEVILEHPELVKSLHEEFVHAGSDVVLAFTYYAHREKLRLVGRENDLERMNMEALRIARQVADDTGTLMAGNLCNSTIYKKDDEPSIAMTKAMFKEQVEWAVKGGADFILGETFGEYGEAALALEAIKKYGNGLPAVITLQPTICLDTQDGINIGEACRMLENNGADVVGLNCGRGPVTIMETIKCVRKACKGPIACLPVTYRTSPAKPTFFSLTVPGSEKPAFPLELLTCLSSREEIRTFAQEAKAAGVTYIGLCCGGTSHTLRIVADVYGKNPPANKHAPEMHKHFIFGDESEFQDYYTKNAKSKIVAK